MTSDCSRFSSKSNHCLNLLPAIRESLPKKSAINKLRLVSESRTISQHYLDTNESSSMHSSKQIYTFCNPPRELERSKESLYKKLRRHISSAPDDNSFQNSSRSKLNQQKSSSSNGSLISHSDNDRDHRTISSTSRTLNYDKQQKDSLHSLKNEQEKSKVSKVVQQR